MSEQTGAPVSGEPTTTPTEALAATKQGDPADKPLGPNGEKALTAEREARKVAEKAAADLKAQLDKIEAANLTDLERAQKAAKDAQDAAAKAATEALRWRIAAKYAIAEEDAEAFLTGIDEAAMTRQAERLVALKGTPTTPRPDPSQGAKGNTKPLDAAHQFAAAFADRV